MLGDHFFKNLATTQAIVALSSGEAEYHGMTKGACEGFAVVLETDSSAAKGIASRKGVGKVKHLETRTLWVQDQMSEGG